MKTIIFICHGNICRSPAAEYIMKQLLIKYHLEDRFYVYSRATSTEEIGNDIYPPMQRALYNKEIPFYKHYAKQITQKEFDEADHIFYMDENNKRLLSYLIKDHENKAKIITCYSNQYENISDPWYTGQFDDVVEQLMHCCGDIIKNIK